MKHIILAATLLLSAVAPLSAASAAPSAAVTKQSYFEYVGSFSDGGDVYDVYAVYDLGGGWY